MHMCTWYFTETVLMVPVTNMASCRAEASTVALILFECQLILFQHAASPVNALALQEGIMSNNNPWSVAPYLVWSP